MANPTFWQYKTTDGNIYDVEDRQARTDIKSLQSSKHYIGTSTTAIEDGGTVGEITVTYNGQNDTVTPVAGQYVIYGAGEYLAADDGKWHKFGDHSGLGALATKDSVTGSVTPEGTISAQTFTGDKLSMSADITPAGSVAAPAFTGTKATISVSGTPKGTVAVTAGAVPQGEKATYTPDGTVAITPTTASVGEITGVGTLPTLKTSVDNGVLSINFSQGTLPTTDNKTVMTGASAAFTGTGAKISAGFTGQATESTGSYTPAGTNDAPKFTGTKATVSVSGTPTGTVSQATFTGKAATVTSK